MGQRNNVSINRSRVNQRVNQPQDEITSTNRMSAKQLVISENSPLEFIENPNTGKTFFVCGNRKGYVSPNVQEIMDSCTLDDLQYAEVSINGNPAVPCLMVVGDGKANVKRSLGEDLLH